MLALKINGKTHEVDVEPETPLLWVLRDTLGMTGTKFGCGIAQCGACTVHVDGQPLRSCSIPANAVVGQEITTIEAITADLNHPVVLAWIEEQVPQCGYCQAGQIMAATALLKKMPQPSDADIDREMTNICRCGTYAEIRKGIRRASAMIVNGSTPARRS
jgi:aerobic-type carbon monoxide dehydrogenase small subunit (CoxS/CutS family)